MTLIIENLLGAVITAVAPGESFTVRVADVAEIHRSLDETRNGRADFLLDAATDPANPQLQRLGEMNLGSDEYTMHLAGAIIADREYPANLFTAPSIEGRTILITVYKCNVDRRDPGLSRDKDPACEIETVTLNVIAASDPLRVQPDVATSQPAPLPSTARTVEERLALLEIWARSQGARL